MAGIQVIAESENFTSLLALAFKLPQYFEG